jgi:hypothetical protein
MKSSKISVLTGYTVLLLSAVLLFGCKPIFEKKPIPDKESKETAAPTAPEAQAPNAPAVAEPATKIEEIQSIQSLESTVGAASTEIQDAQPAAAIEPKVQAVDDGDDVVKATPAIMRKVQQALVNAGFNPGPVDGVSGAKTVTAIESFQKQNNIPTGKLNKRTLRALGVDF